MGWFDDDDDDDDDDGNNQQRRQPLLALGLGTDEDKNGATKKKQEDEDQEEEDEDPLDAYMKSLANSTSQEETTKSKQPRSERLDVVNEEEATSHWKGQEQELYNDDDNDNDDDYDHDTHTTTRTQQPQDSKAAAAAMQSMFHKANSSSSSSSDGRKVNIQLQVVDHRSQTYHDFQKDFWNGRGYSSIGGRQGHEWRREHSISCHPPFDPILDFAQLAGVVPHQVLEWNTHKGITQPTLVQSQTLGVALSGKDAIITASTGSGKTLAYLWPLVTHLIQNNQKQNSSSSSCRALVLVPTRELALQVEKVAKSLLTKLPFSALAITGGNLGRYQLSQALIKKRPHLIVATPGRLLDVLSAQQKSKQDWLLPKISFLVLDEADKMLQLGFASQVTQVLENLRPDRQSLLTSATLHHKLERYCQSWMHDPVRISVGRTGRSSEHVAQHVICLPTPHSKDVFLQESLPTFLEVGRTIVFCATRDGCERLAQTLATAVPSLQTLHGDKHPSDRKAALKAFSKGQVQLLVATDVAGRGLDIPKVATVINYDPAKNWDTHVHRIGRAGRLSAEQQELGSAYTLLLPSNADFAATLATAYEREQRPVSEELRSLARRSRRFGGGGGGGGGEGFAFRPKGAKTGLGFGGGSRWSEPSSSTSFPPQNSNQWYGPSSSTSPLSRKSRWSDGDDNSNSNSNNDSPRKRSRWS